MKLHKKSLLASLAATAVLVGMSTSASAGIDITSWQLNLNSLSGQPGYGNVAGVLDAGINNLSFNGESYVTNTPVIGQPGIYTSTDVGVFDVTQKNGGVPLNLGGGATDRLFPGNGPYQHQYWDLYLPERDIFGLLQSRHGVRVHVCE